MTVVTKNVDERFSKGVELGITTPDVALLARLIGHYAIGTIRIINHDEINSGKKRGRN